MQVEHKTKSMVETSLIAGIGSVLALAFTLVSVPLISIFTLIWPIPFVVHGVRRGIKMSLAAIGISTILNALVLGIDIALLYLFSFGLISLVLADCIDKRRGALVSVLYGGAAFVFSHIVLISVMSAIVGVNIISVLRDGIREILELNRHLIESIDEGASPELLVGYIFNLFPAMIVIIAAIAAFINYALGISVLKRLLKRRFDTVLSFKLWRIPRFGDLYIIGLLLVSFIVRAIDIDFGTVLSTNITIIVSLIFMVQGVSVITYLLKAPKGNTIGAIMCVLAIISGVMVLPMAILGMLDVIFDLRKIRKGSGLDGRA